MTFEELIVGNWYFCRIDTYSSLPCKVARMRLLAKHPPNQAIFVYRKGDADQDITGSSAKTRVLTTMPMDAIAAPEIATTPPLEHWDTAPVLPPEPPADAPVEAKVQWRKLVVDLQTTKQLDDAPKRSLWKKLTFQR